MLKDWKIIPIIMVFPILINYIILTWRAPGVYGTTDGWLSFLGNYSGGLIGALVAYLILRVKENNVIEQNKRLLLTQLKYTYDTIIDMQNNTEPCYLGAIIYDYNWPEHLSNNHGLSEEDKYKIIKWFQDIRQAQEAHINNQLEINGIKVSGFGDPLTFYNFIEQQGHLPNIETILLNNGKL